MFRKIRTAAAVTAVLLLAWACQRPAPSHAAPDATPSVRLARGPSGLGTVDVAGLPAEDLSLLHRKAMTFDEWTALLRVTVAGGAGSPERPAVRGAYSIADGVLRFTPQFPFDPGQRYDVLLDPSRLPPDSDGRQPPWRMHRIATTIEEPAGESRATTRIVAVYPTAGEVPENQLRLYILFSAPMGLRGRAEHVRLVDEDGRAVVDPFLPLDVDLWNADRTRYTLLFDPGRVKRGILPNEEMGRALIAGRRYALVVDADWRDASGQPLAATFRREFRVGPPEERAIDSTRWSLEVPSGGTREPLAVSFPKPLDYALLQRALTVADASGERLDGEIQVERGETRWLFTPRAPWQPGGYRLLASSVLEDVAGNRIGRPFESAMLVDGRGERQATAAALPFRIRARARP